MRPGAAAVFALLAAVATAPALARNPYLVRDLDPRPAAERDSSPAAMDVAGALAFFPAATANRETGLWRTDGTPAGTLQVAELDPNTPTGSDDAFRSFGAVGQRLLYLTGSQLWASDGTVAGTVCLLPEVILDAFVGNLDGERALFFGRTPGATGLWASDGTAEGTTLVREALFAFSGLLLPTRLGDAFVFRAGGGGLGEELWRSDGTPGGTYLLRDIAPGDASSYPASLTPVGDDLIFFVALDARGTELWKTDGTTAGTVFVKDTAPPAEDPPSDLIAVGPRLFFIGYSAATERGLWVSDGTAAGTHLLDPLAPRALFSDRILDLAATDDRLFLLVNNGDDGRNLWTSDGTPGGTRRLTSGLSFDRFFSGQDHDYLRPFEQRVLFVADEGAGGFEPWSSDGTVTGTRRLADICAGSCSSRPSGYRAFTSGIYFEADDGDRDKLWVSDGTSAGTRAVLQPCSTSCCCHATPWLEWRGEVYVTDGFGAGGRKLWKTDGSPGGTVLLTEGNEVHAPLGDFGDLLLFANRDAEHGLEPWTTDGTPAGTRLLKDLVGPGTAGSEPRSIAAAGERVILSANDGSETNVQLWGSDGRPGGTVELPASGFDNVGSLASGPTQAFYVFDENLWRTDGTVAGCEQLTEGFGVVNGGPEIIGAYGTVGDRLFFFARDTLIRLWTSDGTVDGTRLLVPFQPPYYSPNLPPGDDRPARSAALGGRLVFAAGTDDFEIPAELWVSDGTAAGTRRLGPTGSAAPDEPLGFAAAGGRLYFTALDQKLWATDGTAAGTKAVAGPFATQPAGLAGSGNRVFFTVGEPATGDELWASDGTAQSTRRVADIDPTGSSRPQQIRGLGGGRVVFTADDGVHGRELWTSDGTAAGTLLVADIRPGLHSSAPQELTVAGGRVFFTADDGVHGRELWVTDGTAAGTRLTADIFPGPGSSFPGGLKVAGDLVFFRADDGIVGSELWAYAWRGVPPVSEPPAAPTGLTATYQHSLDLVRLTWQDRSSDEDVFLIEWTSPEVPWQTAADAPANSEQAEVNTSPFASNVPLTFRVRAVNGAGASPPSNEASVTLGHVPSSCVAGDQALCLLDDRFEVRVVWRDQHNGGTGVGHALPFSGSNRTGLFWFFNPANVELIVKNLDGRSVNGAFWSFYGALSDVEYWVTVTDVDEPRRRTYHNPPGEICGVGDTGAFPEAAPLAEGEAAVSEAWPGLGGLDGVPSGAASGTCAPGAETLCLLDGRFAVEVNWHDQHNGGSGRGQAVPGTDKSGFFWFFSPSNLELVTKMLDATSVNGHFWVFWGALSDVEYTITVTDTVTGTPRTYHNPPGEICGGADTEAF